MRRLPVLFVSAVMVVILAALPVSADVEINAATFPDEAFRNYIARTFDTDSDRIITDSEIAGITEISVNGLGIESLKGIEHFTALEILTGEHNRVTEIDLSGNTSLRSLNLNTNLLTGLDVSCLPELRSLSFANFYNDGSSIPYRERDGNRVRNIDLSRNPLLEELYCDVNDMDSLDISGNTLLSFLDCGGNNFTALDVSNNTKLKTLICWGNQLASVDVSHNTELDFLNCGHNPMIVADVSKNLKLRYLDVGLSLLTSLDVSHNTMLEYLECGSNSLTALDVSHNTALKELRFSWGNKITDIDLSRLPNLISLDCIANSIERLDLSHNPLLESLHCENNLLTALDVTGLPNLRDLSFGNHSPWYDGDPRDHVGNRIHSVDISRNPKLKALDCRANDIEALDVANNLELSRLICGYNVMKSLDLSENTLLTSIDCSNNNLVWLNIDNCGQLVSLDCKSNDIPRLNTGGCPKLVYFKYDSVTIIVNEHVPYPSGTKPAITTSSLRKGTIARYYSTVLKASGTKPITWTASGLPDGLKLTSNGRISGNAKEFGTFTVKFTASNSAGSAESELTLTIKGIAPKLSGTLAKAALNEEYSSGLRLRKGSTPITWSISGTLPDGLSFDTSTGIISGTPVSYSRSGFRLRITASNGAGSKTKSARLIVKGTRPRITTSALTDAAKGQPYSMTLSAAGSGAITWTAQNLPAGLSVEGDTISGTPSESGTFRVRLRAENPVKYARKTLTLKVSQ